MHAVDPSMDLRLRSGPEECLINELIAVTGECSDRSQNQLVVEVSSVFWLPYLRAYKNPSEAFLAVLGLKGITSMNKVQAAEGLSRFVREKTALGLNSDVVRKLMGCRSFIDVHREFPPQRKYIDLSDISA